jgi:hypothetical protein
MADITVQVSSAGLTAFGASSWSSESYGGDNSTSTTIGSLDAFNNEGWGRLTWGSLTWNRDFENQTVQVTTPGKGTEWGSDVWGDAEWGQITGMDTDLGASELTVSIDQQVTGEELNSTTDSVLAGTSVVATPSSPSPIANTSVNDVFGGETNVVQVTSPSNDEWGTELWGSGQWGVGDGITIFVGTETEHIADGNVEVTGNQIDFETVGTVEIPVVIEGIQIASSVNNVFGGEVVEVQVTTASATNWGDAPFGAGQFGQGPGTDISQGGEEIGLPSQEVPVTNTNLTLNSFANNQPTITADANVPVTGQEITTVLGNEDAIPNTIASPTGIELTTSINNVLAGISDIALPTGVTMTSSSGTIGLNAWELVDSGTAPTWTVVDPGTAPTWTVVDKAA